MANSFSVDERIRLEQERERMYSQLGNEMDEKINQQCQFVEKLKEQLLEQEELISTSRRDYEKLQKEMARIQAENEAAKDEVKVVLQVLEELALNYNQKASEAEDTAREFKVITEELEQKQQQLSATVNDMQQLKITFTHRQKKTSEMLTSLLQDLNEALAMIGKSIGSPIVEITKLGEKVDEEFIVARLMGAKMKVVVKNLVYRCQILESSLMDSNNKRHEYEKSWGLKIAQTETKMNALQETAKDVESRRRALEDQVDILNHECMKLRAKEKLRSLGSRKVHTSVKKALQKELEEIRAQHQKQVQALRDEIDSKQNLVDQLRDTNQNLCCEQQELQEDYDELKMEETDRSAKLQQLVLTQEKREQASKDLNGLQETVSKELQTVLNLRKMFVNDLKNLMYKSIGVDSAGSDSEEDFGGSLAQKEKIFFLETNLEQLTKVHKQLVRDNADLRCELPKLEKRLRATMERVKALEAALREAKEGAMRDRKRYQYEIDRIKEAVKQKNLARRSHADQIAKPIRAGQPHFPMGLRGGDQNSSGQN